MNTTVKHIISAILTTIIVVAVIFLSGEPTEEVKHPYLIYIGCLAAIYGFGKLLMKINPELGEDDEEA